MRRRWVLAGLLAMSGCDSLCGEVSITGVAKSGELARYQGSDGTVSLAEVCGVDIGSFALVREDLKLVTFTLDANVPTFSFEDDLALSRVLLPAASVSFWAAHLEPGQALTGPQLAGSGLHKRSEPETYLVYPLTNGSVKVLAGPRNRKTEYGDWSEEWQLEWSLEFGGTAQKWSGKDWVMFSAGTQVGSANHVPAEPKP